MRENVIYLVGCTQWPLTILYLPTQIQMFIVYWKNGFYIMYLWIKMWIFQIKMSQQIQCCQNAFHNIGNSSTVMIICILVLWIHKGYCVVKKLVWNVCIKAFWYKVDKKVILSYKRC